MSSLRRHPHLALGFSYAAMLSLAIVVNLLPVFLTDLGRTFGGGSGLSKEQLGRIAAALFIGLVAAIVIAGPLADRVGAKALAVGGNVLAAAGLAMLAAAQSYGVVLAASLVMGLGAGTLDMVLSPLVAVIQPHRRGPAMNLLHAFYCLGAVGTVAIGSLALEWGVAWRSVSMALIAVPVAVGAGFTALVLPPLVGDGLERAPLRRLIGRGQFRAACAAIFLVGATELAIGQWLPTFAETSLGYSKWVGGMALAGFLGGMLVGRVWVGMLHRADVLRIMIWCCAATAGLYVLACFAPWPAVALGAAVAMGLGVSCLWPSVLGVAADRFPHGGATMFAALAAFGNIGGIVMPWVVGALADKWGLHIGLATTTVCPILLIAVLMWMAKQGSPHDATMPVAVAGSV
jgi:fucose permease